MELTWKYKKELDLENEDLDELYKNNENREDNPYFKVYKVNGLIIGKTGSGKTTWLINYFRKYRELYGVIILIAPKHTTNTGTYKGFKEEFPNVIVYNIGEEDFPTIDELIEIRNDVCPTGKICVVLDDWINSVNKLEEKRINEYFTQTSRASCDVFCLVQDYTRIKSNIRQNINCMIIFLTGNLNAYYTIMQRWFSSMSLKLDQKKLLFKEHCKIKYVPLILINDVPPKKSILFDHAEVRLPDEEYSSDDDSTSD